MVKIICGCLTAFLGGILCSAEFPDDFKNPETYKKITGKAAASSAEGPTPGIPAMRLNMPGIVEKKIQGKPEWNRYEGISFKIKGDGSEYWGVLYFSVPAFRWNHYYYFPLKNKDWTEYRVAWSDMAGPLPYAGMDLGTPDSVQPSDIRAIGFGTWRVTLYEMKRIEPYSYAIADLKFEEKVEKKYQRNRFQLLPFEKFAEKLKRNKSLRIACVGDSITAGNGGGKQSYSYRLGSALEKGLKRTGITSYNRGIGGSGLLDHIRYAERDLDGDYDLVTLMIGYNDVGAFFPPVYKKLLNEWLDRVAFHTKGKAAVLLIPPLPGLYSHWDRQDAFADVFREVAKERNVMICDLAAKMKKDGHDKLVPLIPNGKVHFNPAGHEVILKAVTETILKNLP